MGFCILQPITDNGPIGRGDVVVLGHRQPGRALLRSQDKATPASPGARPALTAGEAYFIYGKMRSSLGAAGKRAGPAGATQEQGTMNQGVGANKGPGLLRPGNK